MKKILERKERVQKALLLSLVHARMIKYVSDVKDTGVSICYIINLLCVEGKITAEQRDKMLEFVKDNRPSMFNMTLLWLVSTMGPWYFERNNRGLAYRILFIYVLIKRLLRKRVKITTFLRLYSKSFFYDEKRYYC